MIPTDLGSAHDRYIALGGAGMWTPMQLLTWLNRQQPDWQTFFAVGEGALPEYEESIVQGKFDDLLKRAIVASVIADHAVVYDS